MPSSELKDQQGHNPATSRYCWHSQHCMPRWQGQVGAAHRAIFVSGQTMGSACEARIAFWTGRQCCGDYPGLDRVQTRLRDLAAALRANAIKMSLPGLTRQSICFEKALAKSMDARVKPGHDECFCVAWFKAQFRDLAAPFRARFAISRSLRSEGAGNAGRSMRPQPRVQGRKHTSVVTTVTPETTRHSPRNGFTAYFVLSPVTRLV